MTADRPSGRVGARAASTRDSDELARIHAASATVNEAAWSALDFHRLLLEPHTYGLIATDRDNRACGLLIWRRVLETADILALAVQPAARRQGIARALLTLMLDGLRIGGSRTVTLEAAASNAAARALYAGLGFTSVGQRRGYYRRKDGTREDAIIMSYELL